MQRLNGNIFILLFIFIYPTKLAINVHKEPTEKNNLNHFGWSHYRTKFYEFALFVMFISEKWFDDVDDNDEKKFLRCFRTDVYAYALRKSKIILMIIMSAYVWVYYIHNETIYTVATRKYGVKTKRFFMLNVKRRLNKFSAVSKYTQLYGAANTKIQYTQKQLIHIARRSISFVNKNKQTRMVLCSSTFIHTTKTVLTHLNSVCECNCIKWYI